MSKTLELTGLTLRVKDLEQQLAFYRDLLGLEVVSQGHPAQSQHGLESPPRTDLALPGGKFTLTLIHEPSAPLRPRSTLGLYHFALLTPDRAALAGIFRRLVEAQYPHFQGASDHLVSEALYLSDPEGNGIELYRDRPRSEWAYANGHIAMDTRPLDLEKLLAEAPRGTPLHPDTTFGHLHLHVASLEEAERFFTGLGLEVTQRDYPGALFLAADGYHHHIGANLWARGRTAPPESTGLLEYQMALAGHQPQPLTDPNGAKVSVRPL